MKFEPFDISILIPERVIHQRVRTIGKEVTKELQKFSEGVVVICVLNGSYIFFSDLLRCLHKENLVCDFISVSSYHKSKSSGKIHLNLDIQQELKGKQVVLVEDIVDSGYTMSYLQKRILSLKPKRLMTVVLVKRIKEISNKGRKKVKNKLEPRDSLHSLDYVGFEIKDGFLVGYGMDYQGLFRNLPYIGWIKNIEEIENGNQ